MSGPDPSWKKVGTTSNAEFSSSRIQTLRYLGVQIAPVSPTTDPKR